VVDAAATVYAQTVTTTAVSALWTVPAADASLGGAQTTAAAAAATWTVAGATATPGALTASSTAVSAVWTVPAADASLGGAQTTAATAASAVWGVPAAAPVYDQAVTATAASATWTAPAAVTNLRPAATGVKATWVVPVASTSAGAITSSATAVSATWVVRLGNTQYAEPLAVVAVWVVPSPAIAELVTSDLVVPTTVGRRAIRRLRQTPHLSDERITLFYSQLKVDMETGVGTLNGQGEAPKMMLQWSTDRGHTWSTEHWIECGPLGAYRWRAIWRRLGRSRDMVFRIVVTDPIPVTLIDAYVDVTKGTS
jgi:hypothetical protein